MYGARDRVLGSTIAHPYCYSDKSSFFTNSDQFYLLENKHRAKTRAEIRGDNELPGSIGNNQYLTTRRPCISLGGGVCGGGGFCYYLARSGFTLSKKPPMIDRANGPWNAGRRYSRGDEGVRLRLSSSRPRNRYRRRGDRRYTQSTFTIRAKRRRVNLYVNS